MIRFNKFSQETPYLVFIENYKKAFSLKQENIEAICISSYSKKFDEVNSRFVNLKYINDKEFIFFSNYNSPKAEEFLSHKQVTALFFWNTINIQIRMKGVITKTPKEFNDKYFKQRSDKKNALAISSEQSQLTKSYEEVKRKYNKALHSENLNQCPEYWGGYSFIPNYFEFWEGNDSRINKREVYENHKGCWKNYLIQP